MKTTQFFEYDGIAIYEENSSYSYRELVNEIEYLSRELDSFVEDHDIVCLNSDYHFESIALFFALSQKNCILVPIVPTTEAEFQSKLSAAAVNKIVFFEIYAMF